jgi:hypothetical protein
MDRHILQRKDPRVQRTQNQANSDPKIATDLANAKSRNANPVEIQETLTIEAHDPGSFDQIQRINTVQFLKDNLCETDSIHKIDE